jgi:hypothetical protein
MTKYKLVNDHKTPAGGWRYRVPETGYLVKGGSFVQLNLFVRNHYVANSKPVPANLEELLVEFMCKNGADCEYDEVPVNSMRRGKSLEISDVVRFTGSLLHLYATGGKVDQAEANRRASICAGCPHNVETSGCFGCNSAPLKRIVQSLVQHGTTPVDEQLKACEFCGCLTRSIVWFPIETLSRFTNSEENNALPAHCWKKTP